MRLRAAGEIRELCLPGRENAPSRRFRRREHKCQTGPKVRCSDQCRPAVDVVRARPILPLPRGTSGNPAECRGPHFDWPLPHRTGAGDRAAKGHNEPYTVRKWLQFAKKLPPNLCHVLGCLVSYGCSWYRQCAGVGESIRAYCRTTGEGVFCSPPACILHAGYAHGHHQC
jgi:hypothetical protein